MAPSRSGVGLGLNASELISQIEKGAYRTSSSAVTLYCIGHFQMAGCPLLSIRRIGVSGMFPLLSSWDGLEGPEIGESKDG
jgi:hypothetical protein